MLKLRKMHRRGLVKRTISSYSRSCFFIRVETVVEFLSTQVIFFFAENSLSGGLVKPTKNSSHFYSVRSWLFLVLFVRISNQIRFVDLEIKMGFLPEYLRHFDLASYVMLHS